MDRELCCFTAKCFAATGEWGSSVGLRSQNDYLKNKKTFRKSRFSLLHQTTHADMSGLAVNQPLQRQLMLPFMLCSGILPATGLTYVRTTRPFWGSCSSVVASRLWLTAVFSSQHCQFWEGSCWFTERFSLAQLLSSEIHESSAVLAESQVCSAAWCLKKVETDITGNEKRKKVRTVRLGLSWWYGR